MIVVDASAALSALLNAGPGRSALASEQLHAPHLVDSEVANGLRRGVAAGRLDADVGWTALDAWRRLGLTRYPVFSLLDRVLGTPRQPLGLRRFLRGAGRAPGLQSAHSRCSIQSGTRHPLPDYGGLDSHSANCGVFSTNLR